MTNRAKAILVTVICVCVLAGCGGGTVNQAVCDYGSSEIYTEEERKAAAEAILKEFRTWDGCELHSLTYASDRECTPENVRWLNELATANRMESNFTQCILFKSDFHSPKKGGGGWNDDFEYTAWQWWLARAENGEWKLMTWGY